MYGPRLKKHPWNHAANGEIESAVKEIQGHICVLKLSLEGKLGKKLQDSDLVLAWAPRHAADLISRFRKGADGKTVVQRSTGR